MKPTLRHADLRRAAIAAETHCQRERSALDRALARLRARRRSHGARWILAGGFAAGAVAARLPFAVLLRVARFVADTALFVRRLPILAANADAAAAAQEPPA